MAKDRRVLLVDDQKDFAQPMFFWFQSQGFSVDVAFNGNDAIKLIKDNPPDIVFIDLLMPEMDGPTLLKKVREFNQNIPVIIMSSYIEDCQSGGKLKIYNCQGIFYKADDFSKALSLVDAILDKGEKK